MDMSDHLPQWGCPYCSRVFPSRDDLKKHLEPDKQLIIDLLSQLQQALFPSCQQPRETTEGSTASEGGSYVDPESTKRSHTDEPFRCPHPDCETKQAFCRKDHLLRHFKTHVICNVVCECGTPFDYVDQFEKHIPNCQITQGYKAGIADREKEYKQMLGTKKILTQTASQALNELLRRSPTPSQSEKTTKSSSSNDTPNTTVQSLKRKRASGELDLVNETLHRTGAISHQEDSMLKSCNGAAHLGSLDSLDYPYIAGNISKATQVFGNSIPHLYPNELNDDPLLADNTVNGNTLTHESNNFGHTRPPQTENAGGDWSHFYASDDTTSSSLFTTTSGDGLDWNSLYGFNNMQAAEAWTDVQGKATNI